MVQHIGGIVLQGVMSSDPRSASDRVCRESPPYIRHWEHLALNNHLNSLFFSIQQINPGLFLPWIVFGSVSSVVWEGKASVCGPPWLLHSISLEFSEHRTEDGAPFIPQILLIRRKCILNGNCVFWLAQEAEWSEPCGSLIWDHPSTFHRQGTSTQAKLCFMAFCDPSVWSLIPRPHSSCSWWSQDTECSRKVFLLMLHLCGAHAFNILSGKGKRGFPASHDTAAPQHQVLLWGMQHAATLLGQCIFLQGDPSDGAERERFIPNGFSCFHKQP